MNDVWKIVCLSALAIGMWVIGYICGKLEGYDEDVDFSRKFDISSNPNSVKCYLDVGARRKGS